MKFTVIILVGGQSSRMGEEKYAVEFNNHRLIDFPLELAEKLNADEMLVIGNDRQTLSGSFSFVKDELKEVGPLGGICAGLKNSSNEMNLVMPCDTPFLNEELMQTLLSYGEQYDVVVPSFEGRIHAATGVYKRSVIQKMEEFLNLGNRKLMDFVSGQKLKVVDEHELDGKVNKNTFINLNSKLDIEKYGN